MNGTCFAHSAGAGGGPEELHEHLRNVAERAAEFAGAFDAAAEARIAGLLHDAGKAGELFQRRLAGEVSGVDHWSAGAWAALMRYKERGVALALAIAGHHTGLRHASQDALRDLDPARLRKGHPDGLRLSEPDAGGAEAFLARHGLGLPGLEKSLFALDDPKAASAMLDVRMLYSALVDADFIETQKHFQGEDCRPKGLFLRAARDLEAVGAHIAGLAGSAASSSGVASLRQDVLSFCLAAAEKPPGPFTLTAPTGAGKTLAMLSFALCHAALHGLRRVIVVIPYLGIIEQTVNEYRKIFAPLLGPEDAARYILEDHSLARAGSEEQNGQRPAADFLAENWDAPAVVTTSVQFFESLFSNRPAACRKLHRIAKSVVLMDEVQTLPVGLAVPTLATLSALAGRYRASVVLSTATQPAFGHLDEQVGQLCPDGWKAKEIIPQGRGLFGRARRTSVAWPGSAEPPLSWEALAGRLCDAKNSQALCILNLKRQATALFKELQQRDAPGLLHLSTNMCPAHRAVVLEEARKRLHHGKPCLLVSTQCVEAGVDVDFPLVFRAFGPLDAVAQAAGRCNRNGGRKTAVVTVFTPEDESWPDGAYRQAAGLTRLLAQELGPRGMDIHDPGLFARYFRELYDVSRPEKQNPRLRAAIDIRNFVETARHYRLIKQDSVNVLAPYDAAVFDGLARQAREEGINTAWIARARPHAIGVFRPSRGHALWEFFEPVFTVRKSGREEAGNWFLLMGDHYDADLGFDPPQAQDLIIA